MLDDDQWDELNTCHQRSPQTVQYVELNAHADKDATDKLATILGRSFKYDDDWTSLEL